MPPPGSLLPVLDDEAYEELEDHEAFFGSRLRGLQFLLVLRGVPSCGLTVGRGLLTIVALIVATAACGKKGPPLLPFARVPEPAEITATRRVGSDIYVTVMVPTMDIDKEKPASLQRVEVYGATSLTPPPRPRFLDIAQRVATIPVARAADPGDTSGTVVPDPKMGALQGTAIVVRDSLAPADLNPRELPAVASRRASTTTATVAGATVPQALRRFYMAIPYNHRGVPGPPSAVVEIPLVSLPETVPSIRVTQTASTIVVEWAPAGGLLGWLLDRSLPPEVPPVEDAQSAAPTGGATRVLPPGPTLYNVYREIAPDPLELPPSTPATPWASPVPTPVNAEPLAMLTYTEELAVDQRLRCYQVRAVRGTGPQRLESGASERACILPADIAPPLPVTGLSAVAEADSIMLTWDPNGEEDLSGYVVLRRTAGSDTLAPLGTVNDTRYQDKSVMRGQTYTYVVQAIDGRFPLPNRSEPTEVTEMAR